VITIVMQVAKALGKVHAAGLLHRDIKPDNIFLVATDADEDLFVKLLDFGIAKSHAPDVEPTSLDGKTKTGQVVGTPFYMSPEQVTAQKVIDFRSDLWSLGVVAFEALTGQRPFDGPSFGALAVKIATGVPYKPTELKPTLPASVDEWFARACAREPSARFASARELADRLRASFEGVVSLPPAASGMSDSGPRARSPSGPETLEREISSADTAVDARAAASTPRPVDGGAPISIGTEANERPSFVLASTVQEPETSDRSALARSEPGGAAVAISGERTGGDSAQPKGPPRGAIVVTVGLLIAVGVAGIAIGRRSNDGAAERTPAAGRSDASGKRTTDVATSTSTATSTSMATASAMASVTASATAVADASVSVSTDADTGAPVASASAQRVVHVTKPPALPPMVKTVPTQPPAPPSAKPTATSHNDDPLF
jgi:serine/threonine-protein kinase